MYANTGSADTFHHVIQRKINIKDKLVQFLVLPDDGQDTAETLKFILLKNFTSAMQHFA